MTCTTSNGDYTEKSFSLDEVIKETAEFRKKSRPSKIKLGKNQRREFEKLVDTLFTKIDVSVVNDGKFSNTLAGLDVVFVDEDDFFSIE